MKPLKHIEQAKNLVDILTYELKNRKDQRNVKRDATRINTIIALVNAFEEMLNERYYTESIEMLLYARIHSQLFARINKNDIDIHSIVKNIDTDIYWGLDMKKNECINFLQSKEIDCRLMQDEDKVFKPLTDWKGLLEKLVNEFKMDLKWKKLK